MSVLLTGYQERWEELAAYTEANFRVDPAPLRMILGLLLPTDEQEPGKVCLLSGQHPLWGVLYDTIEGINNYSRPMNMAWLKRQRTNIVNKNIDEYLSKEGRYRRRVYVDTDRYDGWEGKRVKGSRLEELWGELVKMKIRVGTCQVDSGVEREWARLCKRVIDYDGREEAVVPYRFNAGELKMLEVWEQANDRGNLPALMRNLGMMLSGGAALIGKDQVGKGELAWVPAILRETGRKELKEGLRPWIKGGYWHWDDALGLATQAGQDYRRARETLMELCRVRLIERRPGKSGWWGLTPAGVDYVRVIKGDWRI